MPLHGNITLTTSSPLPRRLWVIENLRDVMPSMQLRKRDEGYMRAFFYIDNSADQKGLCRWMHEEVGYLHLLLAEASEGDCDCGGREKVGDVVRVGTAMTRETNAR